MKKIFTLVLLFITYTSLAATNQVTQKNCTVSAYDHSCTFSFNMGYDTAVLYFENFSAPPNSTGIFCIVSPTNEHAGSISGTTGEFVSGYTDGTVLKGSLSAPAVSGIINGSIAISMQGTSINPFDTFGLYIYDCRGVL